MATYMVKAPDGIKVGATGLYISAGYPVGDSQIGNMALVRAMVEEGVLEPISDLRGMAISILSQLPGIYPELANDLIDAGIPSEAEIEAASQRGGTGPQIAALQAIINADISELIQVRGIGETKAERLQEQARTVALRMGR